MAYQKLTTLDNHHNFSLSQAQCHMPSEARVHNTYIVNINPCHHDSADDSFDSIHSYSPLEDFEDEHDSSDYAQDEADVPDVQSHDGNNDQNDQQEDNKALKAKSISYPTTLPLNQCILSWHNLWSGLHKVKKLKNNKQPS